MDYSSLPANELAELCRDSLSGEAWEEFVRRFQRPIALAVMRKARNWGITSQALVDDLVQEVFLRICANRCHLLKTFIPREPDSFVGFLMVIAANVTHDHFRGETTLKRGGRAHRFEDDFREIESVFTLTGGAGDAERAIQMREIDDALQSFVPHILSERDQTIFQLYFKQGFSARDIASIASIGLTVKGVESSIHRTTSQLRLALQRPRQPVPAKGFQDSPTIYKEQG